MMKIVATFYLLNCTILKQWYFTHQKSKAWSVNSLQVWQRTDFGAASLSTDKARLVWLQIENMSFLSMMNFLGKNSAKCKLRIDSSQYFNKKWCFLSLHATLKSFSTFQAVDSLRSLACQTKSTFLSWRFKPLVLRRIINSPFFFLTKIQNPADWDLFSIVHQSTPVVNLQLLKRWITQCSLCA